MLLKSKDEVLEALKNVHKPIKIEKELKFKATIIYQGGEFTSAEFD